MTDFKEAMNIDRSLTVGQPVEARWTWCHGYYAANAVIVKVNKKSVRVELLEDVDSMFTRDIAWPKGRELRMPRFMTTEWSVNNGVFVG